MAAVGFSTTACSRSGNNGSQTSQAQQKQHNKMLQHADVQSAIARFRQKVPQTAGLFNSAYGYAVFPSVGKGALVLGGAHGGGEVYKQGKLVGHATMTKFSIGPQAGGKTFSEVIFFQDSKAFEHFTGGNFQFSANATAAGVKSGATENNDYSNGILVFTITKAALMAGANIGGQKFTYTPIAGAQTMSSTGTGNYGNNGGMNSAGAYNAGTNNGAMNNGNGQAAQAQHRKPGHSDVQNTIAKFKQKAPQTAGLFNNAYGYAVFPSIGKGALVLGGAHGGGEVYKQGKLVGHATMTKFSIGAQAGGKMFSEVIFFQNAKAFKHFTGGNFQFSANATAAGAKSGATANNNYSNGVLVFTMTKAALMAGVNIGGQKFTYTPVSQTQGSY
ncbi:MAG: YSC84-related protein [Gammaproteobacteria bacterium]